MSDLLKLAERCEAATGPDRELDEQCALAAGYSLVDPRPNERLQEHKRWVGPDGERNGWVHNPNSFDFPPHYTASIDAAMTLVSEGWDYEIRRSGPWHQVTLWPVAMRGRNDITVSTETTPALALCAAALRARSEAAAVGGR